MSRSQQRHSRRLSFRKEIGIIKGESPFVPLSPMSRQTLEQFSCHSLKNFPSMTLCERRSLLQWLSMLKGKGMAGFINEMGRSAHITDFPHGWLQNAQMNHGKLYPDSSFFKTKLFFCISVPILYMCVSLCVHVWTDVWVGLSDILHY